MKKITKKLLKNKILSEDVAVLAVYLTDGHKKPVDTEDIAIKANELAPGRFNWRKYPDQINLDLVRANLKNSSKQYKGNNRIFLAGSGKEGWTLTTQGLEWVKKNKNKWLASDLSLEPDKVRTASIDISRLNREKNRIKSSKAWKLWSTGYGDKISAIEAGTALRADAYVTGRMLDLKINRFKEMFEKDEEIIGFLDANVKILKLGKNDE